MFNLSTAAPISLFISLAALAGVTLHDTKIDKLATSVVGIPAMMMQSDGSAKSISSDPHTHVERVSLNDIHSSQPRLMPRAEHRKHMMQKNMPKGSHGFDGYGLPLSPTLL